jgi:3-phenylpropionate/trans-cinnamate dioxygenase ferredoxin component
MLHYTMELSELIQVFKKKVVIEDSTVLMVWLNDSVYAIQDRCTHLGASLSKGTIDLDRVTCRSHGASFELATGNLVEKPHVGPLKMPAKKAKTFQTVIKEGKIYIDL